MRGFHIRRAMQRTVVLVAVVTCSTAGNLSANEEYQNELNELRNSGKFAEAVSLLEQLEKDADVGQEFKDTIPLELGITYIQWSRTIRNGMERRAAIEAGKANCKEFLKKHGDHDRATTARGQLANLLVEQARMSVAQSKNKTDEDDRKADLARAEKLYDEAQTLFATNGATIRAKLEGMPAIRVKNQLRTEYLQTRLLIPAVVEEKADCQEAGSKTQATHLAEAAKMYHEVYTDYRTRLAGLYARLYEGRCQVKLKNHREALAILGELLEQPDTPAAFRSLKRKTLMVAVPSWIEGDRKEYEKAIQTIGKAVESLRPDEEKLPESRFLQLALARSYKMKADSLRKTGASKDDVRAALNNASELAGKVAMSESPYRKDARKLLAEIDDSK